MKNLCELQVSTAFEPIDYEVIKLLEKLGITAKFIYYDWSERYQYDANGNLIQKKLLYKTEFFTYNESNRISEYQSTDMMSGESGFIAYTYDCLGRLVCETNGEKTVSLTYDGLSFDVIAELTEVDYTHDFRYRHISDDDKKCLEKYFSYIARRNTKLMQNYDMSYFNTYENFGTGQCNRDELVWTDIIKKYNIAYDTYADEKKNNPDVETVSDYINMHDAEDRDCILAVQVHFEKIEQARAFYKQK